MVKPFGTRELIARVEAHLRRERRLLSRREGAPAVAFGGLSIDMIRREVRYLGKRVPLTRREFDLVRFLALHPRQVFSREQIYDRVWEMDSMGSLETVTEHVKRVRKKLAEAAPETSYIETVWGVGYRWKPGPQ